MREATMLMIGSPLGKVVTALNEGRRTATDTWVKVQLGEGHAQAAYSLSQELDKIAAAAAGRQCPRDVLLGTARDS
ncbi:MAG: hypothetical protein PHQ28_00355 [Mycobacterium sp.]|nr:hypothetical protein [Mycobacterium sp.]